MSSLSTSSSATARPPASLVLVLGLLTALGPSGIDMYLPALPALAASLRVDAAAAQSSLMAFYLALGAGQLVAGPLSDAFGRRLPVLAGLVLFVAASAGCALAPDLPTLIVLRLLQGLGACAGMVTPRAVVRDLYTGPAAARLMGVLMMIYSVSPIVAPLVGSFAADAAGWRSVFAVLAGLGLVALVLVWRRLPDSRAAGARDCGSLRRALQGYGVLLRDARFLAPAAVASLSLAAFFLYVANSAFVFASRYGITGRTYAVLFAANALVFVAGTVLGPRFTARVGLARGLRIAVVLQAGLTLVLLALLWSGTSKLAVLVVLLACAYGLCSVVVPSCFVLAMADHPQRAGSASALIGTFNFAGGALAIAAAAPFMDGSPRAMVTAVALCFCAAAVVAWRVGAPRAARV